jgi:hypothetical protein
MRVSNFPPGQHVTTLTHSSLTVYRHSLIKRTDGNDVTIWVHNSFDATVPRDEDRSTPLEERRLRQPNKVPFQKGSSQPCFEKSMRSLTSSTLGAFTGGVNEIFSWGRANPGRFVLDGVRQHTGLVIAGSNSGANACFMAKLAPGSSAVSYLGSSDVAYLARDSTKFQRQYGSGNSGWKTAAEGSMRCPAVYSLATKVDWRLTFINANI